MLDSESLSHQDSAELLKKHPEIIANPRLEHTKVLISVPTYHGEWSNGVLVRNLLSILSQNLQKTEAVEVNYVFNMNGELPAEFVDFRNEKAVWEKKADDDEYWSKRKIADEAIEFLKKVVQVQSDSSEVQNILDSTADPIQKKVLELAALKRDNVVVSVVNALDVVMRDIGYHNQLSGFRTMGMDYAEARLDDDGVIVLFDTDAIPQDNQFAHNINALFEQNPETKYALLRLGYQTSGVNKKLIESSPEHTFQGTRNYSTSQYSQTTQMVFRKEVFSRLKEIMDLKFNPNFGSTRPGEEDRDTAMRLIGLYADMSDGMLFQVDRNVGTLPVSLVEDRVDGLFDGASRGHSLERAIPSFSDQMSKIASLLADTKQEVIAFVDKIPDGELKQKLETELVQARTEFIKKQSRNVRFNRALANAFLKFFDSSEEIRIGQHDWIENNEIKRQIAEVPNGIALLTYLTRNKEVIDELTSEDIAVMKYCVGFDPQRPAVMDHPSDFQRTMIEYLGYVDPEHQLAVPDELRSSLQPMLAEIMAYSHIYSLYQLSQEFYRDGNENESDFIRKADRRKREDIVNYQAVQEGRDKTWLGKINSAFLGKEATEEQPPEEQPVEEITEQRSIIGKIIQSISPKFALFLDRG